MVLTAQPVQKEPQRATMVLSTTTGVAEAPLLLLSALILSLGSRMVDRGNSSPSSITFSPIPFDLMEDIWGKHAHDGQLIKLTRQIKSHRGIEMKRNDVGESLLRPNRSRWSNGEKIDFLVGF